MPNEYMMPYQFIYKAVSLLMLNDNSFVYPLYDRDTLELKALYLLNPIIVEPIVDKSEPYYLKFNFESGESFIPSKKITLIKGFRLSSKGFVLLVWVSFCIKAIAQRHLITNIMIQSKGVIISDISAQSRALFSLFIVLPLGIPGVSRPYSGKIPTQDNQMLAHFR